MIILLAEVAQNIQYSRANTCVPVQSLKCADKWIREAHSLLWSTTLMEHLLLLESRYSNKTVSFTVQIIEVLLAKTNVVCGVLIMTPNFTNPVWLLKIQVSNCTTIDTKDIHEFLIGNYQVYSQFVKINHHKKYPAYSRISAIKVPLYWNFWF